MRIYQMIALLICTFLMMGCGNSGNNKTETTVSNSTETVANSNEPIELNSDEFLKLVYNYNQNKEWKFEGDKPCVVDFYATWCGPCKAIAPIIDELAKEYSGKVNFYKVDVDKSSEVANAFGIESIPTLFFIPMNGDPIVKQGLMSKDELNQLISSISK